MVIAIISILAAMLLPALGRARKKAKSVSCVNNLSQFSKAVLMYQNDNDSFLPLRDYGTSDTMIFSGKGPLSPYLPMASGCSIACFASERAKGKGHKLICPSAIYSPNRNTYAFNQKIVCPSLGGGGIPKRQPIRAGLIRRPSRTSLMTDYKTTPVNSDSWTYSNATASQLQFDYRHGNGQNVLFVAGHVKYLSRNALPHPDMGFPYYCSFYFWVDKVSGSYQVADVSTY